jgi:endonuclease/exonuclease/phosphatase family metal-dependent hydrolase
LAVVWVPALLGGVLPDLPAYVILVLTVLPVVAAALTVWTFVLWTVLPDHPAAGWLFAASVLAPLAQWGPGWPDRGADPAPTDLHVMTWNVRRLWGGPNEGRTPLACVVEGIKAHQPDVLVLQEVTAADVAALSAELPLRCAHATYSAANAPDDAGLAVCEGGGWWPMVASEPVAFAPDTDWRYLRATFARGDDRLIVLGVHLHPYRILHDPSNLLNKAADRAPIVAAAQDAQIDALLAQWLSLADPTIIAGDFNSTRDTPFHARLRRWMTDAWERGATGFTGTVEILDLLPLRIDYIYASPRLPVVDAQVPTLGCSDHEPVIARLTAP